MSSRLDRVQNWPELARQANWSAARLAKLCGVSVRTLERHFLKVFRQSPKAWMATARHAQAAKHLTNHTPVKETASLMGYHQATTFAREFKKLTGQCPHDLAKPPGQTGAGPENVA